LCEFRGAIKGNRESIFMILGYVAIDIDPFAIHSSESTIELWEFHREIIPFVDALLSESSPIAIKHILAIKGIIRSSEVRLPLCASSAERLREIEKVFL
jgi:hypothetical protein